MHTHIVTHCTAIRCIEANAFKEKVLHTHACTHAHTCRWVFVYLQFNDPMTNIARAPLFSAYVCVCACMRVHIHLPMLHHCWLLHSYTSNTHNVCAYMMGLLVSGLHSFVMYTRYLKREMYTHALQLPKKERERPRAWEEERMHRKTSVSVCVCCELLLFHYFWSLVLFIRFVCGVICFIYANTFSI